MKYLELLEELVTTSRQKIVVVVGLCLLVGHVTQAAGADQSRVQYAVLEGQPGGTLVGDLLRDLRSDGGPRAPTFSVRRRQRPFQLPFSVDRRSGIIRTVCIHHHHHHHHHRHRSLTCYHLFEILKRGFHPTQRTQRTQRK